MVGYFITLYAMLCHAMLCYATLFYSILFCSILFYSALFSSIQSCATCAYKEHKQIIKEYRTYSQTDRCSFSLSVSQSESENFLLFPFYFESRTHFLIKCKNQIMLAVVRFFSAARMYIQCLIYIS